MAWSEIAVSLYIRGVPRYDARLMLRADAKILDLHRIRPEAALLQGGVPTASMSRLQACLVSLPDVVEVDLRWWGQGAVVRAAGRLRMQTRLPCQRCLTDMPLLLEAVVDVGFAASESLVEDMDSGLDAVVVEHGRLQLPDWVEDELLLVMPISPMCQQWRSGVCPVSGVAPYSAVED